MQAKLPYEPDPRYAVERLEHGWREAVEHLPVSDHVLAVDGPSSMSWDSITEGIAGALTQAGRASVVIDVRAAYTDWPTIVARTSTAEMAEDPDFDSLCQAGLHVLFDTLPVIARRSGVTVIVGPGAALVQHDVLWYADVPKRIAEAMCQRGEYTCLGQRMEGGDSSTKRMFYVDWPALDRHRDGLVGDIGRWIDARDPHAPTSVDGDILRRSVAALATEPFRTKPWFNSTVWGGHWAQEELGVHLDAETTALGYELIAPESGIVLGDEAACVEIPLQMVAALCPEDLLGSAVHQAFGTSFPIRFDYLDTAGGGPLSVHCHPRPAYMRDVFGWPYTQHESYYVMKGAPGNVVYLGLQQDVEIDAFRTAAQAADEHGTDMDVESFVQTFPAEQHQLFMIPAGTPHASGEGNVVLEISATPYLYSLRFYDWLRGQDGHGQRPVHVHHAFANVDDDRRGERVGRQLVQQPRTMRTGPGWQEAVIGALDEMFFEVRRFDLAPGAVAPDATADRFHILNVVEGAGAEVEASGGAVHRVAYAETVIVPAAVGPYRIRGLGEAPVRVVKAFVR